MESDDTRLPSPSYEMIFEWIINRFAMGCASQLICCNIPQIYFHKMRKKTSNASEKLTAKNVIINKELNLFELINFNFGTKILQRIIITCNKGSCNKCIKIYSYELVVLF